MMNKKVKEEADVIIKKSWLLQRKKHPTNGGAMGDRTPDLLVANETLYQLSYDPICGRLSWNGRGQSTEKSIPLQAEILRTIEAPLRCIR